MSSIVRLIDANQYTAALALLDYINDDDDAYATLSKANGTEFEGKFAKLVVQSMNPSRKACVIFDQAKVDMIRMLDTIASQYK